MEAFVDFNPSKVHAGELKCRWRNIILGQQSSYSNATNVTKSQIPSRPVRAVIVRYILTLCSS